LRCSIGQARAADGGQQALVGGDDGHALGFGERKIEAVIDGMIELTRQRRR
jgi:hypothetical protein